MQKLFTEFKPNTAVEWKNQLIKDLKGEAYESLIWHNENGFDIKPFYTSEDLTQNYEPAFTHTHWEICVEGKSRDPKVVNAQFLKQLNAGATSLSLNCKGLNLETALKDIQLSYIQSTFFVDGKAGADLKNYLEKNHDLAQVKCSIFPLSFNTAEDLADWHKVIELFKPFDAEGIKMISVNATSFHNQNCLAYYEVAVILSQLTEYQDFFEAVSPEVPFVVKAGVSSDYFIQIAKLRALRRLWVILRDEFNKFNDLHLIVETSLTNKSISDNYNNLLRTTVESMSAISGGCNELIVTEFDVLFPANKVLSERMAVNQQLVLKEESYFDKMADTACGSFYIESITDAIARKALETFKRFEKEGGYFKCLEKGIFSEEISVQAKQREELLNNQKQISIGVNKFKNEKEKIGLSSGEAEALKNLQLNNPALNFELEHYFNLKNA